MYEDGTRADLLIGDGAGIGKGSSIAGIIIENKCRDRTRAVWVSCSSDLEYDAEGDVRDIGCDIEVIEMKKVSNSKMIIKPRCEQLEINPSNKFIK